MLLGVVVGAVAIGLGFLVVCAFYSVTRWTRPRREPSAFAKRPPILRRVK